MIVYNTCLYMYIQYLALYIMMYTCVFMYYTCTCAGERRIRVHTLCLPVSSQPSVLYSKLNVRAIVGVLANMGKIIETSTKIMCVWHGKISSMGVGICDVMYTYNRDHGHYVHSTTAILEY